MAKQQTCGAERSSDGRVGNKAVSGNSDYKGIIPKRKQSTGGDETTKVTGGDRKTAAAAGKSGNEATTSGYDRNHVGNKAVSRNSDCKSQRNNT